jgi:hypothetical protein
MKIGSRFRHHLATLRGPDGRLGIAVFTLLALTGLNGLSLFPQLKVDHGTIDRLQVHVFLGSLALVSFLVLAFRRFRRALGLRYALWKIPVLALVIFSNFVPFTGEMLLACTSTVLLLDWRWTRRVMARQGATAAALLQARRTYLDFAVLLQSLLTGLLIAVACSPVMLMFHRIHGLALPLLVVWFAARRIRPLAPVARMASSAALLAFLVVVGWLYYAKQIDRSAEVDKTRPDVLSTVERTADVGQLKPNAHPPLGGSLRCGGPGCHNDITNQWRGSSHRFSVDNAFFQKEVALFIEMEGTEYVRTCINCHDPIAALTPGAEALYASGRYDNPEGISCPACHSITTYDAERGNGLYTIKAPVPYPDENGAPGSRDRARHDAALHLDPRSHLRDFRRKSLYRGSEYCITCHLVHMPSEVTGGPPATLHTLFDQWRNSEWSEVLNCVDCHMPRFQMDENGYTFFDHRFLGINSDLLLGAKVAPEDAVYVQDFIDYTTRYIAGDLDTGAYEVLADPCAYLFSRNPAGEINPFTLGSLKEIRRYFATMFFLSAGPIIDMVAKVSESLTPARGLRVDVTTSNARVGHNFPSGPIDVQEIWLEAELLDSAGAVVDRMGALDADNFVDPRSPILGCRGVEDAQGRPLVRHEFWKIAKIIGKRVLEPFGSVEDVVELRLPEVPAGEYRLKLKWNFRRMSQRIANWVWDGKGVTMPVMVLDESEHAIVVKRQDDGSYAVDTTLVSRPGRRDPRDILSTFAVMTREPIEHPPGKEMPSARDKCPAPETAAKP